jgi:hypothetical protein
MERYIFFAALKRRVAPWGSKLKFPRRDSYEGVSTFSMDRVVVSVAARRVNDGVCNTFSHSIMNPSAYLVRVPLIALVVVVFSACSSFRYSQEKIDAHRKKISVSINSFGTYDMRGATFVIDSGDSSLSTQDVEFGEYTRLLSRALCAQGAVEIKSRNAADVIVLLNYGVTGTSYKEVVPTPVWGQTGITTSTVVDKRIDTTKGKSDRATTRTEVSITPTYGVTGYSNVERTVTMYNKYMNIYAYENRDPSSAKMLWKTNLSSQDTSDELREVIPYLVYCGSQFFGRSAGEKKLCYTFTDGEEFRRWSDPNSSTSTIFYPRFACATVDPASFAISRIDRRANETAIEITVFAVTEKLYCSRDMFIEFNDEKRRVRTAEGITLGQTITRADKIRRFTLIFPPIPDSVTTINLDLHYDGWAWSELQVATNTMTSK